MKNIFKYKADVAAVINMDRSIHKYINFNENISPKLGIPIIRYSGVDLNNESNEYINKYITNKQQRWFFKEIKEETRGQIGCSLAHANVLRSLLNTNYNKAIILEDDVFISPEFNWSTIRDMPNEYDFMYLYAHYPIHQNVYKLKLEEIQNNYEYMRVLGGIMSTSAYIINLNNKKFVNKLINNFELGIRIDTYLALEGLKDIVAVVPKSRIFHTTQKNSEINYTEKLPQYKLDYNPFIKHI